MNSGELFARLGYAIWTVDEAKLGAVGAVGGAGPAYVARFVRALAKAGEAQGLEQRDGGDGRTGDRVRNCLARGVHGPYDGCLATQVASPNGTTEAGLAVLDQDQVLDELVGDHDRRGRASRRRARGRG